MDFKVDIRTQQSALLNTDTGRKGRDLAKLKEACSEFEAIYLNEMFKSARQTIPEGGLFEKSNATHIFEDMQDMERARNMSKNASIGIADTMYKQMAQHIENKKE